MASLEGLSTSHDYGMSGDPRQPGVEVESWVTMESYPNPPSLPFLIKKVEIKTQERRREGPVGMILKGWVLGWKLPSAPRPLEVNWASGA